MGLEHNGTKRTQYDFKLKAAIETTFGLLFCFELVFLAVELYCDFSEVGGTPLTTPYAQD